MIRGASLPPERMTPRARAYLLIAGTRHLLLGLACLLLTSSFQAKSYDAVKGSLPFVAPGAAIPAWGVMFLGAALLCYLAASTGREGLARWALLASVISSSCWAGAFVANTLEGHLTGPSGPIIWTAVTLKDITMLRAPLRNPFEPIIRRALAETRAE